MNIQPKPSDVTITFSPYEYCLTKCKDRILGDYTLNYLIDRSEEGKTAELGIEIMYLLEQQAEIFKRSGFKEFIN
jgi:N-acetylglutamate synthase-like GNAT family acetyltransferase